MVNNQQSSIRRKKMIYTSLTASNDNCNQEVLIAVAVLGLIATAADGKTQSVEVARLTKGFKRSFALTKAQSSHIMMVAIRKIMLDRPNVLVNEACQTLNIHLTTKQKLKVHENLADILVADGVIHEGEELYLAYIANRLELDLQLVLPRDFNNNKSAILSRNKLHINKNKSRISNAKVSTRGTQ